MPNPNADKNIINPTYLKAETIYWSIGPLEPLSNEIVNFPDATRQQVIGFRQKNAFKYCNHIPTEFFSHELLDLDVNNIDLVTDFMEKFGLPFSPFREIASRDFGLNIDYLAAKKAIDATERLFPFYFNKNAFQRPDGTVEIDTSDSKTGMCVSLEEACLTLKQLQDASRQIQEFLHGRANHIDYYQLHLNLEAIVLGSCNPYLPVANEPTGDTKHTPYGYSTIIHTAQGKISVPGLLRERSLFTSAICNQIMATLASPLPWRICANENCKKVFKLQRNSRKFSNSDAIYCSQKCYNHQSYINKKRAKQ